MKKSLGKKIFSFLFSTLMMFSIVIAIMAIFVKTTLLNPEKYIKVMNEQNIQLKMYESITGNIDELLMINGLDRKVSDGIITKEEVANLADNFIFNTINYFKTGKNDIQKVNVDEYVNRFHNNIKIFLDENKIHKTIELQKEVNNIESDIRLIIQNELEIINTDVLIHSTSILKIAKITSLFVSKLYLVLMCIPLVFALILLVVWGRDFEHGIQWIANAFISGGLFVSLIFISGYLSKFYYYIIINTEYLRNFVANIIKEYLLTLSIYGFVAIVIGVILLIPKINYLVKRSKMRRKRRRVSEV